MITVQKMFDDLDYWIMIGIGDDIVKLAEHRPEYQHLVKKFKETYSDADTIANLVLEELRNELRKPLILRPTFWRLIWLKIVGNIRF